MFRGKAETKIDAGGRLKLPAAFKRVLDEDLHETKVFLTSLNQGKTARIYTISEWQKLEAKLGGSSFNTTLNELKTKLNIWGSEIEMDPQGRLLIPQDLRAKGLAGEVCVIGMTNFLEICTNAKATELAEREFTESEQAKLDEMGI